MVKDWTCENIQELRLFGQGQEMYDYGEIWEGTKTEGAKESSAMVICEICFLPSAGCSVTSF